MKTNRSFALALAAMVFFATCLQAEDWTTTDGKVYQDVKVVKTEPDAVTILHSTGGALVPLINLSPELQKRFNYDPATAEAAAVARVLADAESYKALLAEISLAREQRQAAAQAQDSSASASDPGPTSNGASSDGDRTSLSSGATGPTHHSTSDLVDLNLRLWDDHWDPTHHSMGNLVNSTGGLTSGSTVPNHHSTDDLLNSDPLK